MAARKTLGGKKTLDLGDDPLGFVGGGSSKPDTPGKPSKPGNPPQPEQEMEDVKRKTTYALPVTLTEEIRSAAYWSRKNINDVAQEWLEAGRNAWEKEHGEVKPRPE